MVPLRGPLGIGISGEYFDRRTYYQDESSETQEVPFPAVQRVPDMETVVSRRSRTALTVAFALAWFMPVVASSQTDCAHRRSD